MAYFSREEEVNIIIQMLEAELNDLVGELREIKKRVCQPSNHTDKVSRRMEVVERSIELYNQERKEIEWDNAVGGVTSKM